MKTQMNSTSLDAYHGMSAKTLSDREREVMRAFLTERDVLSRQEISEFTGMALSGIYGRVNSLLAKGVLCVRGRRKISAGRWHDLVGLPVSAQGSLFGRVA